MGSIFSGAGLHAGLEAARTYLTGVFVGDPLQVTLKIVRTLLDLVALVAVAVLIIAGLRLITSMGAEDARDSAKRMIRNTLIGLILIVLSRVIVSVALYTASTLVR